MKLRTILHVLRFLHFNVNRKELDKSEGSYDRLWKMRSDCDKLNTQETQIVWSQNLEVALFQSIYT
jgi:hypothetical protein